jgi:hypothetical protein
VNNPPQRWFAAIVRCLRVLTGLASWLSATARRYGTRARHSTAVTRSAALTQRIGLSAQALIRRAGWSAQALTRRAGATRWYPVMARRLDDAAGRVPVLGRLPRRNAVLSIAGLAIVGGAIAGPVAATSSGQATTIENASALSMLPAEPGAKGNTAPLPAGALTTATPTQPAAPFEKALYPDFELQPNYYYCGPAATRLAITAHATTSPSMDDLAWMLGTTVNGTNSAFDTTRVLNKVLGAGIYQTHEIPGMSATARQIDGVRTDMVNAIANGYAGVANIVGGTSDINGIWHEYDGGHYVSVVGYGQGGLTMKIADPANPVGDGTYWVRTIDLANWMGTRGYSA